MFGWFKPKKDPGAEQLGRWLDLLKACDGAELGLPVALAAHFRNKYALTGRDFNKPQELAVTDPEFVLRLIGEINRLQSQGLQVMAPGLMIWVHSFRAARDLSVRPLGRQMWRELSRGFPYAEAAQDAVVPVVGFSLDTAGFDRFPDLLSPEPK